MQGRSVRAGLALDLGDGTYLVTYEPQEKMGGKGSGGYSEAALHGTVSTIPLRRHRSGWIDASFPDERKR